MPKRLQNKIAESRLTLPVTALLATVVWLGAGLAWGRMWMEFVCFVFTTYLMVELNNSNALIRIYSRTVSCSFILLSCAACFTFNSEQGAIAELCVVAAYITLFHTYQDSRSPGWTFYTFLCIGLASMVNVHIVYYVPVLWVVMASRLRSLSLRTFVASLLGLVMPYWFAALYFVYTGDYSEASDHFAQLWTFGSVADVLSFSVSQVVTLSLVLVLAIMGVVHYFRTSYNDRIRIRMFYNCFIIMTIVTVVFLILQPQHYDLFIRLLIINTSPLIAHFIALTKTRWTNITFCVIVSAILIVTGYNLWVHYLAY